MKYIVAILAAALSGCSWYEQDTPNQQVDNPVSNPKLTVLRATVDENDLGDLTILCIDGISYIAIPGIGMSVKYKADNDGDPYVETCVNR